MSIPDTDSSVVHTTNLFLQRGSKVLLAMKKRGFGKGKWNGVGGKLDKGETPEQAAIREAEEEIRVTPKNIRRVAELTFDEYHNGKPHQVMMFVFVATDWLGEPKETDEMAPQWFDSNELPLSQMWPDDEYWLEAVLHGALIRGHFTLNEQDVLIKHSIQKVSEL